jgi:hypothetical protein
LNRKRALSPAIAVVLAIALMGASCAGNSPQRDALNTLQSFRATVVAAVGVFNKGYQAGTFSDAQRTQLGVLYNQYLLADTAAADAIGATTTTDPSTIVANVTVLGNAVINFVTSLKAAPSPAPVLTPAHS